MCLRLPLLAPVGRLSRCLRFEPHPSHAPAGRTWLCLAASALLALAGTTAGLAQTTPTPRTSSPELGEYPTGAGAAFDANTLWRWSWASDPRLSPDGQWLVYNRVVTDPTHDGYSADLGLIEVATGTARSLTSHPENDLGGRWSPEGQKLAFVSSRVKPAQLFVLDLVRGGEARQITFLDASVSNPAWSPDGRAIAFTTKAEGPASGEGEGEDPDTAIRRAAGAVGELETAPAETVLDRLASRSDGSPGYVPKERTHIWIVELGDDHHSSPDRAQARSSDGTGVQRSHSPAHQVTDGPHDDGAPAWSADGAWLYFSGLREEDADWRPLERRIYRVAAAQSNADRDSSSPDALSKPAGDPRGEPEALTGLGRTAGDPQVSPDGKYVAFLGMTWQEAPPSYRASDLWVMRADGSELRNLSGNFETSLGDGVSQDVASPRGGGQRWQWSADSKSILATSASRGQVNLHRFQLDGSHRLLTTLEKGGVHAFTSAGASTVALYSQPDRPAELYAFGTTGKGGNGGEETAVDFDNWRRLTFQTRQLEEEFSFVDSEEIVLPSFDGQEIQGWILKPPGFDAERKYPLVLYIHGGPHTMYGTAFFHEFQVLAHAGYVVLYTNPRGSSGYGSDFGNIIQYNYPGDDFHDLMAAVDAVVKRGYVDESRLAVAGGSGGGLLTAWTVGHSQRFAAAVAQRNVTNWHSFVGTADFNLYFVRHWFRQTPWENPTEYLERSPLRYVDRITTPLLLIHSEQDYRTPLEQSLQLYTSLRMMGKTARLVIFPEASHGLSRMGRPSHRIARLSHILEWFDTHAGDSDRSEP